mgnify:FL=1
MMWTLLQLAIRNVLRNKARTALTFTAIFLGVLMTILLSSFGNGLGTLMRDDVILGKVGAVQIHRAGYSSQKENPPIKLDMPDTPEFAALIRSVPGM